MIYEEQEMWEHIIEQQQHLANIQAQAFQAKAKADALEQQRETKKLHRKSLDQASMINEEYTKLA